MPNFNGTGPNGQGPMTRRKRGRCRVNQTAQIQNSESQTPENKEIVYGVGRGGRPRGGGQGNCYGGNKRKGRDRKYRN